MTRAATAAYPAAMRRFALLALLAVHGTTAAQEPPRLTGRRPNILFVFSDDHATQAISAYGSAFAATPNIDRLAVAGTLFSRAFCGNAICGPSRASVLTGKHSHANGFFRNGNAFDGNQATLPLLLQQAGYQTALFGKWHLESMPIGFDHWAVLPDQGQYYEPEFLWPEQRQRVPGHVTDVTTAMAIEWLEKSRTDDRPFLLMCQHKAPHRPWQPAPEDLAAYATDVFPEPPTLFDDYRARAPAAAQTEMEIARHLTLHYDLGLPPTAAERATLREPDTAYDAQRRRMTEQQRAAWDAAFGAEDAAFRADPPVGKDLVRWKFQRYLRNYLRCVAGVDRSVGQLLDWLHAHPDVERETLVVYASDQGFFLGEHGWFDKRWMYEESLRMPLLISWPGHVATSHTAKQLVQNIDLLPTFLELAGVAIPADVHGQSLVPLLEGKDDAPWRDAIYYHYYESQATHMVPAHFGVRTDRYKLIRYYEPQWNTWELFDLQADPHELRNLAADPAHAELRAGLERRLAALRTQYADTTGDLADGAFPLVAGVARILQTDSGWRILANAPGGYVLREGSRTGVTVLTTTMRATGDGPQQNGYLVATGSGGRQDLVRVGVAFNANKLLIAGPGDLKQRASIGVRPEPGVPIELRATFDLDRHVVIAEALGQRIEAPLPPQWLALSAWGFGANNAETEFAEIAIH